MGKDSAFFREVIAERLIAIPYASIVNISYYSPQSTFLVLIQCNFTVKPFKSGNLQQ